MSLRYLLFGGTFSALAATLPALDLAGPPPSGGPLHAAPAPAAVIWAPHMPLAGASDAAPRAAAGGPFVRPPSGPDPRARRTPGGLPGHETTQGPPSVSTDGVPTADGAHRILASDQFGEFVADALSAVGGSDSPPWPVAARGIAMSPHGVLPPGASGAPRNPHASSGPFVPHRGALPLPAAIVFTETTKVTPVVTTVEVPLPGSAVHLGLGLGLLVLLARRGRPGGRIRPSRPA